jgi:hypothetical protein
LNSTGSRGERSKPKFILPNQHVKKWEKGSGWSLLGLEWFANKAYASSFHTPGVRQMFLLYGLAISSGSPLRLPETVYAFPDPMGLGSRRMAGHPNH